jgi:non-ribosomal peptide synthetase component F
MAPEIAPMTDNHDDEKSPGSDDRADALLDIVRDMAAELHPGRRQLTVSLTSDLDRDLGFDSLARVELLGRVNRAFRVDIGESVLESAQTPADLLTALTGARAHVPAPRPAASAHEPLAAVSTPPEAAGTLIEVLDWHAAEHPERPHVRLLDAEGSETVIHYRDLQRGAAAVTAGLMRLALPPGTNVAIMLPTSADYLSCFFGVLMAGAVPVPIYPPARATQIEEHLRRHAGILDNAQAALLITVERARTVARLLEARVPSLTRVATVRELSGDSAPAPEAAPPTLPTATAEDVAFLQYTSGSTGDPKGVVLTHANLLANVRAMGRAPSTPRAAGTCS